MDGDELLQDGWQGGGIKQTGGPAAENKCRRQLKYRTYPQSYFHLLSKLIKPLFPLQRHHVNWIFLCEKCFMKIVFFQASSGVTASFVPHYDFHW